MCREVRTAPRGGKEKVANCAVPRSALITRAGKSRACGLVSVKGAMPSRTRSTYQPNRSRSVSTSFERERTGEGVTMV